MSKTPKYKIHLSLKPPNFSLPKDFLLHKKDKITLLKDEIEKSIKNFGTGSEKFKKISDSIKSAISFKQDISQIIVSRTHVRAFSLLLMEKKYRSQVSVTRKILESITRVVSTPTFLVLGYFYQYYLFDFKYSDDFQALGQWLFEAKKKKNILSPYEEKILSLLGPEWVAQRAITKEQELGSCLDELNLSSYAQGNFMQCVKGIYYIEQLQKIPLGEDHKLLHELQKETVCNSQYDEILLIGHKVIEILITRSKGTQISEAWLGVILAIAGDPRISDSHPRYLKWWFLIDGELRRIVHGWLSRLDLKLFLEAIENFAKSSGNNSDILRMYPDRKRFLEGLFDAGLIQHTRLYLSTGAMGYLERNYDKKHLPSYSKVVGNPASIIYVQMDGAHMIEGTHSCRMWIYKKLDESMPIFDYKNTSPSYYALTSGMDKDMRAISIGALEVITHYPSPAWQKKAVLALQKLQVRITEDDVISDKKPSTVQGIKNTVQPLTSKVSENTDYTFTNLKNLTRKI